MLYRRIVHIDMDAFFASVEKRDNKELEGKPVIVARSPETRGVVATCSYEARKYGIHSAMPSKIAKQKCPNGIFVEPRFDKYREVSSQIQDIFLRYTEQMEPKALDEAYLDVSESCETMEEAYSTALKIKDTIWKELKLTCSVGVSYNKFLAKLASEYNKPNGIYMIRREESQNFLDSRPISDFYGVGKATESTLKNFGIKNGRDLRELSLEQLTAHFNKRGYILYQCARGIDDRPIVSNREFKSIGHEITFEQDLSTEYDNVLKKLEQIASYLENKLVENKKCGSVVTLVIKSDDFVETTRQMGADKGIFKQADMISICKSLIAQGELPSKIRLLGIRVSKLEDQIGHYENLSLFDGFLTQ